MRWNGGRLRRADALTSLDRTAITQRLQAVIRRRFPRRAPSRKQPFLRRLPIEIRPMILGKIWYTLKAQLNKVANSSGRRIRSRPCNTNTTSRSPNCRKAARDWNNTGRWSNGSPFRCKTTRSTSRIWKARSRRTCRPAIGKRPRNSPWKCRKPRTNWPRTKSQLAMHEQAYGNNVEKIKHASGKLAKIREKIQKYDAELKMSKAEAEIAQVGPVVQFRRDRPTSARSSK